MHTRRVGAFLIGAWLLGSVVVSYIAMQNLGMVDRILGNPPLAITRELDYLGRDMSRMMFRYHAAQINRHVFESWHVLQLGLLAAFLGTSILTSNRSKTLIAGSALMIVLVVVQAFYLTPILNGLSRSFDFLPPSAGATDRENFQRYHTFYMLFEVLKFLTAIVMTGRLLFDRYDWQNAFGVDSSRKTKVIRKRRRPGSEAPAV